MISRKKNPKTEKIEQHCAPRGKERENWDMGHEKRDRKRSKHSVTHNPIKYTPSLFPVLNLFADQPQHNLYANEGKKRSKEPLDSPIFCAER